MIILNIISRLTGYFMEISFPPIVQNLFNKMFVDLFRIDLSDSLHGTNLQNYRSLQQVFTRQLREGSRKINGPYASPADGTLSYSLPTQNGDAALQVKGRLYSLRTLTQVEADFSWFTTIYLAPHNYHRVHTPCSGSLLHISHIPGTLWPVNSTFTHLIPQLFNQNERMVFQIGLHNGGFVYVVMVGALNVGKITTHHNVSSTGPVKISCGDELGIFNLGSTVVCVLDKLAYEELNPQSVAEPQKIILGALMCVDTIANTHNSRT